MHKGKLQKGGEIMKYKIEITFKVEKELTESELSNLEGHLLLQIDEPYNEDNEAENYTATDTTYKIERI